MAKVNYQTLFLNSLTDQASMRVTINGKPEDVVGGTVLEVLKAKDIEPQMVAVELNSKILGRDEVASAPVKEGDALELLFYMGGGTS